MDPIVPFQRAVLENGLTLLLHEDHSAPLIALVVMYHVGSKNERPGKTGFAHLFEHLMFKGSEHVADGEHFRLLQEIGASVNGSTTEDRTNYHEVVPGDYLDLALYLESDRMGFLLPSLSQEKLDNQRDVVKNERRQSYDNQPYGRAHETISNNLFPPGHPYSWPVIGSMEDLSSASLQDVEGFFRAYYTPANACLALAGDFHPEEALLSARRYFADLPGAPPPEPPRIPDAGALAPRRLALFDAVAFPRLYLAWRGPQMNSHEDAVLDLLTNVLSAGKHSRLYRKLVYEEQIAQSVIAYQDAMEASGVSAIVATAHEGTGLSEVEGEILRELERVAERGISPQEFQAALNTAEVQLSENRISAFQKANGLATYQMLTGRAENFSRAFLRYSEVHLEELASAGRKLLESPRISLSIIPQGRIDLAASGSEVLR